MNFAQAVKALCGGTNITRNKWRPGFINATSDVWLEVRKVIPPANSAISPFCLRRTGAEQRDYAPSLEDICANDWVVVTPNGDFHATIIDINPLYT